MKSPVSAYYLRTPKKKKCLKQINILSKKQSILLSAPGLEILYPENINVLVQLFMASIG